MLPCLLHLHRYRRGAVHAQLSLSLSLSLKPIDRVSPGMAENGSERNPTKLGHTTHHTQQHMVCDVPLFNKVDSESDEIKHQEPAVRGRHAVEAHEISKIC